MKKAPLVFIGIFICCLIGISILHFYRPIEAEFFLKIVLACGTLAVVSFALYGDYLKSKWIPIDVKIEHPESNNNIFDRIILRNTEYTAYCHHLCVRSKSKHKPLENCRVWLREIAVLGLDGNWVVESGFAVPRLMNWAPKEYSPDKRTFSTTQIFDVGMTLSNNGGFLLTINDTQGGNFKKQFIANETIRCTFYVTADNYLSEKNFHFEIKTTSLVEGKRMIPAEISFC